MADSVGENTAAITKKEKKTKEKGGKAPIRQDHLGKERKELHLLLFMIK